MKEFHLSCIDQQSHLRAYGRVLLIFEFERPEYSETAIHTLRGGFAGLLRHFPYLAGVVEAIDTSGKRVKVSYTESGPYKGHVDRIFGTSTSLIGDPVFDFKTLQAADFPHEAFLAEHFCPASLADHHGLDDGDRYATGPTSVSNGISLPVLATQATFIGRGLVLSLWIHHSIADGTGWGRIFEVWADNVKSVRHKDVASDSMRNIILRLRYTEDSVKPQAALDALARRSEAHHDTTHASVQAPALRVAPYATPLSVKTGANITNFIALAALLATYISKARCTLLSSHNIPKTTLAVVVNLRKHLGPQFTDPDYIGNCMLCSKASHQLSTSPEAELSDPSHLAPFALAIAQSIMSIDEDWISNRLAPILLSDPPVSDNSDLTFGNGPDLYITSWQHMGADTEWCIPGTKEEKPIAIRRAAWESEGGIVILPRRKESLGPFEVMVSLAEEDMWTFREMMGRDGWVEDGAFEGHS